MKNMCFGGLILLASAMLLSTSCAKELRRPDDGFKVIREFKAIQGEVPTDSSDTKVSLNTDKSIDWSAGDSILYYSSANGAVGKHIVEAAGNSTVISAEVGVNDKFFVAAYGGDGITENTADGFTLSGAIKAEQTGKFKDAYISVAKTSNIEDPELAFHCVNSIISFTLERTDISYVVFTAAEDAIIHSNGEIKISFNGEDATASFGDNKGSSIKINTNGAGTFYFATLAGTLNGFTIDCYDADGFALGRTDGTKILAIKTNNITKLGIIDSKLEEIPATDLSAAGTANCYIVPQSGRYKFHATVKGSSSEYVGIPSSAEVLWESFGTDVAPSAGDIVRNVTYKDEYVSFSTAPSLNNGNAVIAVKDYKGKILWSWHIWVCKDYDPNTIQQEYYNNAGVVMDRNLGATSATPGDVHSLGLLYQWGRKDPFLSGGSISGNYTSAESTINWPSNVISDVNNGTIEFSVENPTTFILPNGSNSDWYYTGCSSTDNTRWSSSKELYNPCPKGWKVPDGGENGLWAKAFGTSSSWVTKSNWDANNYGMDLGSTDKTVGTGSIWYPAAGGIGSFGDLHNVGVTCDIWSCTPNDQYAYSFNINVDNTAIIQPSSCFLYRADGRSVRCVRDDDRPQEVVNLSSSGTANCYIVSTAGTYKFNASTKGNGKESVGTPASAEVLWESFGTNVAPMIGDIITSVSLSEGYVTFSTPEALANGNAVIAVKDADGIILWSWHVWVCSGYDPVATRQIYANNAGIMMDRNIGATSATPGNNHAMGLRYQWGRKDPFLGGCSISKAVATISTVTWPSAVTSTSATGNTQYIVNNPMTFITKNEYNEDWYFSGTSERDFTRWNKSKTIYDPCPVGWRVPDGDIAGIWNIAMGNPGFGKVETTYWDQSNFGIKFPVQDGSFAWYPNGGALSDQTGKLTEDQYYSTFYHSCSRTTEAEYEQGMQGMFFNNLGHVYPACSTLNPAGGYYVRCCKE